MSEVFVVISVGFAAWYLRGGVFLSTESLVLVPSETFVVDFWIYSKVFKNNTAFTMASLMEVIDALRAAALLDEEYLVSSNLNRAQSQYARIVDGGNFTKALLIKQDKALSIFNCQLDFYIPDNVFASHGNRRLVSTTLCPLQQSTPSIIDDRALFCPPPRN